MAGSEFFHINQIGMISFRFVSTILGIFEVALKNFWLVSFIEEKIHFYTMSEIKRCAKVHRESNNQGLQAPSMQNY